MSKLTKIKASQITRINNANILESIHKSRNSNILDTIHKQNKQARQTEAELLGISDSDYKKAVLITLSAINTLLARR